MRRSEFDSGAVRQVSVEGLDLLVREVRVDVPDSSIAGFQAWVRQHGSDWFNFTDWVDGVTRDSRIAGGRVTLVRGVGRVERNVGARASRKSTKFGLSGR